MTKKIKQDISQLGSRTRHNVNMFDYLKEKYGITPTFLARKIGIRQSTFLFFEQNGFPPEVITQIEEVIHEMGKDLTDIKIPKSLIRKEAA